MLSFIMQVRNSTWRISVSAFDKLEIDALSWVMKSGVLKRQTGWQSATDSDSSSAFLHFFERLAGIAEFRKTHVHFIHQGKVKTAHLSFRLLFVIEHTP